MRWPWPLSSASLSPRAYAAFPTAHQEGHHTALSTSQGPPPFSPLSPSEPQPGFWSITRCLCAHRDRPGPRGLPLQDGVLPEGPVVVSLSVLSGERECECVCETGLKPGGQPPSVLSPAALSAPPAPQRPKSALERLYSGDPQRGRMSAEEQLQRMKRHQKALVRERKRTLSHGERTGLPASRYLSQPLPGDLGSVC